MLTIETFDGSVEIAESIFKKVATSSGKSSTAMMVTLDPEKFTPYFGSNSPEGLFFKKLASRKEKVVIFT